MENKKLRLLALKVALGLHIKMFNDLVNNYLIPKRFRKYDDEPFKPEMEPMVHVIEHDDGLDWLYEQDNNNVTSDLFGYIPEEVKQQMLERDTKVGKLFSDRRFLIAYKMESREYMIKAIELLYYDEIVDYEIYKILVENKVVVPTDEDIAYFKMIGLIPIQIGTGGNGSSLT